MRLRCEWSRDELSALQTAIIVEGWEKKGFGREKRLYLATFDEKERATLSRLYPTFYDWHLRKGLPDSHLFEPATVVLIEKAVAFFASL